MDEDDDRGEEVETELACDLCQEDHETRDCDLGVCGRCFELLDNCDCEEPIELNAAEWLAQGAPCAKADNQKEPPR
jgi:hypothetical protein